MQEPLHMCMENLIFICALKHFKPVAYDKQSQSELISIVYMAIRVQIWQSNRNMQ